MANSAVSKQHTVRRFMRWLLQERIEEVQGPEAREGEEQHAWWQVVYLTGVDYFSTLGYIPGIAVATAGALSPVATLLIVLLTLFGMLPMYRVVAAESPHGQGSIAMLERLLSFWKGKLFVLCLLGLVATSWVITTTLSASDATAQVVENPFWLEALRDERVLITLALLAVLGGIFLKGIGEAIGIAVAVVGAYLVVNLVVVAFGYYEIATQPQVLADWQSTLFREHGSTLGMIGVALLVFPRPTLGLSGFETGVSMMPLVLVYTAILMIVTVLFGMVTVVFIYALASNVFERPDGITIALFFIGAIIAISSVSRIQRSTELRQERIDEDEMARGFIEEAAQRGEIHLVAHRRRIGTEEEYAKKEREQREDNPIVYLIRSILFGEGDTAPVTHEVLREAKPNPERRPAIHVGGR